MKVVAEVQVIPMGVGVSVRKWVMLAHRVLEESGLTCQLHAYGTNVEGDFETLCAALRRVHETLHAEGVPRISTAVKIGTRTDKEPSLAGKLNPDG